MTDKLDFDLAWGGYYAGSEKDSDGFSVIRLLDFSQHAVHVALYGGSFDVMPGAEDIASLSPSIGHVPVEAEWLLNYENLKLVDRNALTPDDLEGYRHYLSAVNVAEDDIEELTQTLIEFSHSQPMALTLYLSDGELQIAERE